MTTDFQQFLQQSQQRVTNALENILPTAVEPAQKLKQAMRYSALNGGKRVRATLVYAAAMSIAGEAPAHTDNIACALELIHAYSLVHDDLPAMDDDALRRGQPTCHIAFDEATAILVGDALQTLAFEYLAQAALPAELRCELILSLARASGAAGMVAGQSMDLEAENRQIALQELEALHQHKTGALIRASVRCGALAVGANSTQLAALDRYAAAIGLAFQVQDDILDIESSTEQLGKQQGSDLSLNKSTYPSLLGLAVAKQHAKTLYDDAITALNDFGDKGMLLRELAHYIIARQF
ncbi:MAG: (2E,6E)-farnesyl diphosphate synthase [Cellvibrionales bacterium]|nr:(2E,6E)-farnesyl diphosphate synthase [Cellvibrionales bacterium]